MQTSRPNLWSAAGLVFPGKLAVVGGVLGVVRGVTECRAALLGIADFPSRVPFVKVGVLVLAVAGALGEFAGGAAYVQLVLGIG